MKNSKVTMAFPVPPTAKLAPPLLVTKVRIAPAMRLMSIPPVGLGFSGIAENIVLSFFYSFLVYKFGQYINLAVIYLDFHL